MYIFCCKFNVVLKKKNLKHIRFLRLYAYHQVTVRSVSLYFYVFKDIFYDLCACIKMH